MTLRSLLAAACLTLACPAAALAAWPLDPAVNLPLCTVAGAQYSPILIGSGWGDWLVCWTDGRSDTDAVYVQRLANDGTPLWTATGVRVSPPGVYAFSPRIVPDSLGGAIVSWLESHGTSLNDVRTQRVLANGQLAWGGGAGVAVQLNANPKYGLAMVPDAVRGAILSWSEGLGGVRHVLAQHVNESGARLWDPAGVLINATVENLSPAQLVPDGTGGAVATWFSFTGLTTDVFAQRVNSDGAVRWGTDGVAVCPQPQRKSMPTIAATGRGGAIVSWDDYRFGGFAQLLAQRLDSLGTPLWATGGVPFATTGAWQAADTLLADGAGGVFAVWQEVRFGTRALYGQHLDHAGAPLWSTVGVVVDSIGVDVLHTLALDGAGGLLVTWMTLLTPDFDIRAQSLSPAGAPRWPADGAPVCIAAGDQGWPASVGDGKGGLLAVWEDGRTEPWYGDLYAQRLQANGAPGHAAVPPAPLPRRLALAAPWPSPARAGGAVTLRAALPAAAHVRLVLLDVTGRRVRTLVDATRDAGTFSASWDGRDDAGHAAPAGLYFVRLEAAGATATAKLVIAN